MFASLVSLFWATALMLMLIWAAALVLLQAVLLQYESIDANRVSPINTGSGVSDAEVLHLFYGSVSKATLTLFAVVFGGVDWFQAAEPLMNISPVFTCFFIVYISFMVLGVLNVFTGFFIDLA